MLINLFFNFCSRTCQGVSPPTIYQMVRLDCSLSQDWCAWGLIWIWKGPPPHLLLSSSRGQATQQKFFCKRGKEPICSMSAILGYRPLGMKEFLLHFKSLLLSFTIPRLISLEVNLQWSSEQKMLDWVTPSLAMRAEERISRLTTQKLLLPSVGFQSNFWTHLKSNFHQLKSNLMNDEVTREKSVPI